MTNILKILFFIIISLSTTCASEHRSTSGLEGRVPFYTHNPYNVQSEKNPQVREYLPSANCVTQGNDLAGYLLTSTHSTMSDEEKAKIHQILGKKSQSNTNTLYHLSEMKRLAETLDTYEDACIELGNALCERQRNLEGFLEYMNVSSDAGIKRLEVMVSKSPKKMKIFCDVLSNWRLTLASEDWFVNLNSDEQRWVEGVIQAFHRWFFSCWGHGQKKLRLR